MMSREEAQKWLEAEPDEDMRLQLRKLLAGDESQL